MEHRFLEYLSPERVGSGQAVGDAEALVESQQRAEIIGKTIAAAWTQIIEAPDELLVDLISETTERICGFKPETELVEQFLLQRVQALNDALDGSPLPVPSRGTNAPPVERTRWDRQGPTLPITLDPPNSADFLDALLLTREAWIEVSYRDGRKEVRRWDASLMRPSSNVIGNLRSRPEFRSGTWQKNGIASLRVSVERPRRKDARCRHPATIMRQEQPVGSAHFPAFLENRRRAGSWNNVLIQPAADIVPQCADAPVSTFGIRRDGPTTGPAFTAGGRRRSASSWRRRQRRWPGPRRGHSSW